MEECKYVLLMENMWLENEYETDHSEIDSVQLEVEVHGKKYNFTIELGVLEFMLNMEGNESGVVKLINDDLILVVGYNDYIIMLEEHEDNWCPCD